MSRPDDDRVTPDTPAEGRVLSLQLGHSANCSSVGSFVDLLFASTVVGSAVVGAIAILLARAKEDEADERDEDDDPRP